MPRASVAERHPRDPPEDEPERLWHGTTGEDKQRVADHDRRANVTRRLVFGSVHRIVAMSKATLHTSGRAAWMASAMTRSPSIRPTVAAAIASALMVTVACLRGWR